MPVTIRAGDLLAGRYRVEDLLSESAGGRFWHARDQVLARPVAIHVIAEADDRAELLLAAARGSAAVHDPRVLRVLDADVQDGLCFVVNEWGNGTSLDELLATEGPLEPGRAAWIVSEAAAGVAAAHELGVAHGRLIPENVLVDHNGSVRLIGLAVDAALHGLTPQPLAGDLRALGGVLYAGLTGRWPGSTASAVPPAPAEHRRPLRTRQVRAGIPGFLDDLCMLLISPPAAHARLRYDLDSAAGISQALADYVGNPSGFAAAEAARAGGPAPPPQAAPRQSEPDQPSSAEQTAAGVPIFHDDGDLGWQSTEHPGERALFDPDPSRVPRHPVDDRLYWPWDSSSHGSDATGSGVGLEPVSDDPEDQMPGRTWFRLAVLIAVLTLVGLAAVLAITWGDLGDRSGSDPAPPEPGETTTGSSAAPIATLVADDFDPQGSPPEEYPQLVALAVDGDPETAWRTSTYTQNLGPNGLKTGVGITVDTGAGHTLTGLTTQFRGAPTTYAVFVSDQPPTSLRGLQPVTTVTADEAVSSIEFDEPTTGRYLTIWLTRLPAVDGGFRAEIADVQVRALAE